MPAPRVVSVDFLDSLERVDPASGEARVRVGLESGRESSFLVATFDRPGAWMGGKRDHWFAEPVLYVRRLDEPTVRAAVAAMAGDLAGYWLRYYRAAPGLPFLKIGVGMAAVDRVEGGCGVVEAVLKDGREFSILAATPAWWRAELERRRLAFYFGPMVLFVEKIDAAHAKRAAKGMAEADEQLFCRYDTPRKTLPGILDDFQSGHP